LEGYVHAAAGQLVDGRGDRLVLRGVGLGNWLLPEGYMWKFEHPHPQSPREIEAVIEDLVGPVLAGEFWVRFRATFVGEEDIARIRAEGMNHVRLPINSRVVIDDEGRLIESGFTLIDRLIEWCRRHELWVVLDLHGAPGGQTGTKIDDSPHGAPELFTDDRYRSLTVKLWQALARRYRDEPVVAAYDLLNEPLPNEYQHTYAARLRNLYVELTAAIREIDGNHLISYEGSHWATNWDIFTEVWDPNSILQFHKYWSPPDRPSIQKYLDIGRDLGLPIYMGEGGENHLDWIQTAFQLYEDCGISWNFWPWKKVETGTSPCSVIAPAGWSEIVAYAAGRADKPACTDAWQTLNELIDASSLTRCMYRSEVVSAILRRAPLKIPAVGFGFRGAGRSYETSGAIPMPEFRRDDLVTIRQAGGRQPGALDWNHAGGAVRSQDDLLVSLGQGDWVAYDVALAAPGEVQVTVVVTADGEASPGAPVGIAVDGAELEVNAMPDQSGVHAATSRLGAGRHVVRLTGRAHEIELRSIDVVLEP
jgi:endoglucanase